MKIKRSLLILTFSLLLGGCASLFKAPTDRNPPGGPVRADGNDRTSWIEARASQLESKGMSEREAKGQAVTEAALRGR